MNITSKIYFLLLGVLVALASCQNGSKYAGTWQAADGSEITINLIQDNEFEVNVKDESFYDNPSGIYKYDSKVFCLIKPVKQYSSSKYRIATKSSNQIYLRLDDKLGKTYTRK